MFFLLAAATLFCPEIQIIDYGKKLTANDKKVIASTKIRCGAWYKNSPCPKKIWIRGNQTYWVICGKSELRNYLP